MRIDIRPAARLRGPGAVDVPAVLAPIFAGLAEAPVDLARLRLVCDWIQYRHNFTGPVSCRPVLADPHPTGHDILEIAIDLRRAGETDLATSVKQVLAAPADSPGRVVLEPWRPARPAPGWTPSWNWTTGTAATTTGGCTT